MTTAPAGGNRPGEDLVVPPGPGLPSGLVIPASELHERFSHASGPGGQSVNTADSRVELVFDVSISRALTDAQKRRAERDLGPRLVDGTVVVVAAEHRTQHRNRSAARTRLAELLREALRPPPPPRRPTKPSRAARRRRVEGKRRRGDLKAGRGRVRDTD